MRTRCRSICMHLYDWHNRFVIGPRLSRILRCWDSIAGPAGDDDDDDDDDDGQKKNINMTQIVKHAGTIPIGLPWSVLPAEPEMIHLGRNTSDFPLLGFFSRVCVCVCVFCAQGLLTRVLGAREGE